MFSETSHVGLRLLNRFQIEEPLPAGALCRVYRGQDTVLRRSIAVKAIAPERVEIYRRALRATAALSHPAVVATYDAIDHDGWLFIMQEYVTARPLTTYLREGVPSERAVNLGGQIARALAYAHAHDIVHGDLTPSAVLVDRQATVRLNNFRLPADEQYFAQRAEEWETTSGKLFPPDGDPMTADVTSVGLLLWLLLTESKRTGVEEPHRDFRTDVPEPLRALVRRCVVRTEANAIADADTLCQELDTLASELAHTRRVEAEQTPPALRVARAAVEHAAAWSAEATLGRLRSWGPALAGDPVSQSAPTVPQSTESAPWLASTPTASVAPRLRLPSRPMSNDEGQFYSPARDTLPATNGAHGKKPVAYDGVPQDGLNRMWVLVAIALGLFLLFFLIGFFLPYVLGG